MLLIYLSGQVKNSVVAQDGKGDWWWSFCFAVRSVFAGTESRRFQTVFDANESDTEIIPSPAYPCAISYDNSARYGVPERSQQLKKSPIESLVPHELLAIW